MAPRYAHVHVEGDLGIRFGRGNITIEVWDKRDRKVGIVSIGQAGVRVRGKIRLKPIEIRWDDLNGRRMLDGESTGAVPRSSRHLPSGAPMIPPQC